MCRAGGRPLFADDTQPGLRTGEGDEQVQVTSCLRSKNPFPGAGGKWEAPDYFKDGGRCKYRAAPKIQQPTTAKGKSALRTQVDQTLPSVSGDPTRSRLNLLEVVHSVLNNPNLIPENPGLAHRIRFAKRYLLAESREKIEMELANERFLAQGVAGLEMIRELKKENRGLHKQKRT